MTKADIIIEKWKNGSKQKDIATEEDVSEAYVSQVLAPEKKKKKPKLPPKVVNASMRSPTGSINREKKEKKKLIIKYILGINAGHKSYEQYGFPNNHAFLAHITQMIHDL